MPSCGEVVAQPRQRALLQEAGEIIGAVGQQLAAADADEQIEELALDLFAVGLRRGVRQRDMGKAERARIAAQFGDALEHGGVGRARQQHRQQRVFLGAGEIDSSMAAALLSAP